MPIYPGNHGREGEGVKQLFIVIIIYGSAMQTFLFTYTHI
jgi:hypothetical protein